MTVSTAHHFVIEPKKGVGPIRFGMHKDDVSRAFTYVYTSFFKGADAKFRSDDCEVVGLMIHYDDAALVNYIEVYKARYATVTLELFDHDITGISVRGLVELLRARGIKAERSYYGYDFPELAMNTYNDDLQVEDDVVQLLGVGLPE
jgi:hypothetical protein